MRQEQIHHVKSEGTKSVVGTAISVVALGSREDKVAKLGVQNCRKT